MGNIGFETWGAVRTFWNYYFPSIWWPMGFFFYISVSSLYCDGLHCLYFCAFILLWWAAFFTFLCLHYHDGLHCLHFCAFILTAFGFPGFYDVYILEESRHYWRYTSLIVISSLYIRFQNGCWVCQKCFAAKDHGQQRKYRWTVFSVVVL
jgi:hypothetical protein